MHGYRRQFLWDRVVNVYNNWKKVEHERSMKHTNDPSGVPVREWKSRIDSEMRFPIKDIPTYGEIRPLFESWGVLSAVELETNRSTCHDIIFNVCRGAVPSFINYLEIGLGHGDFAKRMSRYFSTTVVDIPDGGPYGERNPEDYRDQFELLTCGSDAFFETNKKQFDAIFIDGDHNGEQVIKDFDNSIKCLTQNGVIFLHDSSPVNEGWIKDELCSTAYKINDHLDSNHPELNYVTLPDSAPGLSIVHKKTRRHHRFTKKS